MADRKKSITDLPLDILVLIFPYLPASSFLALCSTCQAFQQPSIRLDPAYWSFATRSTFRIPNQPVVQHDGVRWQKMYRRLFTQSRVYTWGNNSHSRLGHSYDEDVQNNPTMPRLIRPGRGRMRFNTHCAFPAEMQDTRGLGIIADMQCGGWSTTLLTAKGSLHTVGVLDGGRIFGSIDRLQALEFPPGYPSSSSDAQYNEPAIAIRQFSAGRSHVLAVADSGRIWSWYNVKSPALQVKFTDIELKDMSSTNSSHTSSAYGKVRQVVAGWSQSSAYIHGFGLVLWDPVERDHDDETADTMLVMETSQVPNTGYQRHKDTRGESEEERRLGESVGAVTNYIILEHYVVFATDIGKVFCAKLREKNAVDNILELQAFQTESDSPLDVQGSFRRFAVFRNNEVITSDQGYLDTCWTDQRNNPKQINIPGLNKIPALQNNDVISVSFGDYHYLALHSNGKITSYGTELQGCGALGLGAENDDVGHARGIVYDRFTRDGRLLPYAYTHGRQVWFDGKKKDWIDHLWRSDQDPEEAKERIELCRTSREVQGEVSEWLEQESRARDNDNIGEDDLGAYFALRVSAAGWHSGALVLVNDDLAGKGASESFAGESFPRLKLADGTEMPGTKAFDEWREGRPEWDLDVQA